ncbi:hypothetical protein WDV85_02825 [Pseudokineococcus sp. 5B2Z-1]|uniref:hypothetical protein n=1 Tax=Pseudokineococcus sp. 5B2Z-1 TaxID=3132744 RepID=UPI0030A1F2C5
MAALLVLAVLLVGVPRMARRRAELGEWQAAGRGEHVDGSGTHVSRAGAPRDASPRRRASRAGAAPSSSASTSVGLAAPGTVGGQPLALRSAGTGLRRATPGPRVLERRSTVPRPRCSPGAGSRRVLAAPAPASAPAAASAAASAPASAPAAATAADLAQAPVGAPGSSAPEAATALVRGEVVEGPAERLQTAPATVPPPRERTDGAGAAGATASSRGAGAGARGPAAGSHRLPAVQLLAVAVGAVAAVVLAVVGVLPLVAAPAAVAALVLDVVALRARARRRRARRPDAARAATARGAGREEAAGSPRADAVLDDASPRLEAVLLDLDATPADGAAADAPAPARTGAVTGLLPSLADLRAAAAADSAAGLRGPAAARPRAREDAPAQEGSGADGAAAARERRRRQGGSRRRRSA